MSRLFEPLTIESLHARNRLVRAATAESLCTREGRPTEPLLAVYEALAQGGVGTIITGFSHFCEEGKPAERTPAFGEAAFEGDFRRLVDRVHERGARIVLQLVYGGSKSKLASDDPRWLPAAAREPRDGEPTASVLGPSAVVNPATSIVPVAATEDDLRRLARGFAQAAARAVRCGFDGVELHGAHGYLLSQFLSPRFNRRTDGFGGSIEGRALFPCQCVRAVREAVGEGYPVLVKLNSCDVFGDPEGLQGGLSEGDAARAAGLLQQAGASAIEVSGDWHGATGKVPDEQPYFGAFGARLARQLPIPIIVTGGWRNPRIAEAHLAADGIAAIGLSRPFIREPSLARRWSEQDLDSSLCQECGICQKHGGIPCPYRK